MNHVAKRLGTGLKKLVGESSKMGITLGGVTKGSLKSKTIETLQRYYRNSIVQNLGNVQAMKSNIYATLYHCSSTDDEPRHIKCPTGEESWCFYNRAIAKGENPGKHGDCIHTPINKNVLKAVIPLYSRLAHESLLGRCVEGRTQNSNESIHNIIWSKCPKTTFLHRHRIELAVRKAVAEYNSGLYCTVVRLQKESGLSPGRNTIDIARRRDERRTNLYMTRTTENIRSIGRLSDQLN